MDFVASNGDNCSASSTSTSSCAFKWQVGSDTDIGGGKENQDDYFIWERKEEGVCILGILDGHGRDVGKLAANTGRRFLLEHFEENYQAIATNPLESLSRALQLCHQEIKRRFQEELVKNGYEVMEHPEGYLLKRRNASQQSWLCVHGGTSCSIAAIVGNVCYTANVGDSSAILCSNSPILRETQLEYIGDAATGSSTSTEPVLSDTLTDTVVITAEHSPEKFTEFDRMRKFRCRDDDPNNPALHVVYDAPGQEKIRCPPCFATADDGLSFTLTNKGAYYKNVRKEW